MGEMTWLASSVVSPSTRRVKSTRVAAVHAPDVAVARGGPEPAALDRDLDPARAGARVPGPEAVEVEVLGNGVGPARDLDRAQVLAHRDQEAAPLRGVLARGAVALH